MLVGVVVDSATAVVVGRDVVVAATLSLAPRSPHAAINTAATARIDMVNARLSRPSLRCVERHWRSPLSFLPIGAATESVSSAEAAHMRREVHDPPDMSG